MNRDGFRGASIDTGDLHLLMKSLVLDQAKKKISAESKYENWDSLHEHYGQQQDLEEYVAKQPGLDLQLAKFVCGSSKVQRKGNVAAHRAEINDIRDAVQQQAIDSTECHLLESLKFVYDGSDVYCRLLPTLSCTAACISWNFCTV